MCNTYIYFKNFHFQMEKNLTGKQLIIVTIVVIVIWNYRIAILLK